MRVRQGIAPRNRADEAESTAGPLTAVYEWDIHCAQRLWMAHSYTGHPAGRAVGGFVGRWTAGSGKHSHGSEAANLVLWITLCMAWGSGQFPCGYPLD